MAGNRSCCLCTWIPIVAILLELCLVPNEAERSPCTPYAARVTGTEYDRSEAEVIVFLRETCDKDVNVSEIQEFFERSTFDLTISVMPTSVTCESETWGLDALLRVLAARQRTRALVAGLDYSTCEIAAKLAHLWRVPLLTWTCPLRDIKERELSSIVRLSPSLPSIAKALAEIFLHLRWKSAVMISRDDEPWLSLDRAIVHALRAVGVLLRYRVVLPRSGTLEEIREILTSAHGISRRATILCLPAVNEGATTTTTTRVLAELDRRWWPRPPNSAILMIHTEDNELFLPLRSNDTSTAPPDSSAFLPVNLDSTSSNFSTLNVSDARSRVMFRSDENRRSDTGDATTPVPGRRDEEKRSMVRENGETRVKRRDGRHGRRRRDGIEESMPSERKTGEGGKASSGVTDRSSRFFPPKDLSSDTMNSLLAITPLDQRYDVEKVYEGTEDFAAPSLLDRLIESLNVLTVSNGSINAFNNKMYTYALLDWRITDWKPIMVAIEQEEGILLRKLTSHAVIFQNAAANQDFSSCDEDGDCAAYSPGRSYESSLRIAHIVVIILGALLLTLATIAIAILIRKRLVKKRMSKGPYKIILTTSDFVFPQAPLVDSRTVDEGIETMLCCWLQQLQEFGGPEVEKPDLLQLGSVSSLKPYLRASTGNLSRHTFFKDPRARYNGDLVQLKELSCQGGTFELRGKAMDVLVTIHGLRHENLNPLIGCLNEPTRPCLVYEYCSRGSLEDVLVQDEIKLDWSFRLSLLTDLVRGMRYLHGTPIRVHGYLTSRNCVIDARWVLKVTDYGLPAFYDAQNIAPPAKTARDLLWTAPELLRHASLRKKGTQPGDVYSFGIIMQEVVVRGEPFCMLALSPEDIIEKVMKPPPLIRPSVSKGAAPPEAINIMRQCWAEAADMRPDFDDVHDLFKKLNHGRKVNFVDTMFQMLEKYSNNLEELIRERTEQLDMEKKKTEQLLNRMLPSSVAEKLKLGMPVDPEEFREVTIYFSDIVGFTTISAHSTPFQVVDLLNDLYTCFDATINAYTVYKVETIGDAYMVVAGCPVRIPDHASQIATMALDLLHQSGKFKLRHLPRMQLRLRIGLHTGPCCAGVVGLTMPRYCLFGDTVNTASRMESTGAAWRIHLSQATRDRLVQAGGYRLEYRGRTDVKGKGKMPTYWLLGKHGFDKDLPRPPPLGENYGLDESIFLGDSTTEDAVGLRGDSNLERGSSAEQAEGGWTEASRENVSLDVLVGRGPEDAQTELTREVTVTESTTTAATTTTTTTTATTMTTWTEEGEAMTGAVDDIDSERRIVVSVHGEERTDSAWTSTTNLGVESLAEASKVDRGSASGPITKSTSGDTQASLGGASSCAEQSTAAILGASTSSLTSISSSAAMPYRPTAPARHRRIAGWIDENDLSTPYNHYRCLSPNEHYGRGGAGSRFLKRQFSLDRPDEPVPIAIADHHHHQQQQQHQTQRATPRLYKQNSAGAANDLERIEEVPTTPGPLLQGYRHAASVSLSVESLSLH